MSATKSASENAQLYQENEAKGYFEPEIHPIGKPFCMVCPPPNVTGVLHLGHALTFTLEDILARRKRMQGYRTLWIPGTDHAGIATQMVVERELAARKLSRHTLGRAAFLKEIEDWKNQSQKTILSQLRSLGCSLSWSRLAFTLDEARLRAVREAFVRLYEQGLIYRQQSMTQSCPRCDTALSDLEVDHVTAKGRLWTLRYCSVDDPNAFILVDTTRPETLFGDVAVAVHPDDERYQSWHGKKVWVPLSSRAIPIITDSAVEKDFGTGALKITPAHDPVDWEIAQRHHLPLITIFNSQAISESTVPEPFQGKSREALRTLVLERLAQEELLMGEKMVDHAVGNCSRCGTTVEPRVSLQWFINVAPLATAARNAVAEGKVRIFPKTFENSFYAWMDNIRPWCISRQLWWGHSIPAWYCPCRKEPLIARTDPSECPDCGGPLQRDPDVLDTWFSSGLWPLSTLGWPEITKDWETYFPTDILETGFDILFFWVARMMMLSYALTKQFPFHVIYLHPMVRDALGQKMSKSKGNVQDPLEIMSRVGTDAFRFFLASHARHGQDLRIEETELEGSRHFIHKLENAAAFVRKHFGHLSQPVRTNNALNTWIWHTLDSAIAKTNDNLEQYRFFDAAQTLYQFVWKDFCYWFIEFMKTPEELQSRKESGDTVALEVLEQTLRLLHPFIPFVSERLWKDWPLRPQAPSLCLAPYPTGADNPKPKEGSGSHLTEHPWFTRACHIIEETRRLRAENNVPMDSTLQLTVVTREDTLELLPLVPHLAHLTRAKITVLQDQETSSAAHIRLSFSWGFALLGRKEMGLSQQAELERKTTQLEQFKMSLSRAQAKLGNAEFRVKAQPAIVAGVQAEVDRLTSLIAALEYDTNLLKACP